MRVRFLCWSLLLSAYGSAYADTPKVNFGGSVKIDELIFSEKNRPEKPQDRFYNGATLAGAGLFIEVEYTPTLSLYTELDMVNATVGMAYLDLKKIVGPSSSLMLGQVPSPHCLEQANSTKTVPFLSRSLATSAFAPCSGPGANFRQWGQHYVLNAAATQRGFSSKESEKRDDQWGGSARVVIKPLVDEDRVVHLGASLSHQRQNDKVAFTANEIKGRTTPTLIGTDLYKDGIVEAKNYSVMGAEAAARFGSLQVESDYLVSQVQRREARKLQFSGWSAQGNYFLTGETRGYSEETGSFKGPTTIRRPALGAWQLALRASQLNLNDRDTANADDEGIAGGRQFNQSVALNWYMNEYVRVTAQVIHQQIWPSSDAPKRTVDALGMRLQMLW
jgi:phosphate-selective porin OprO/OprP